MAVHRIIYYENNSCTCYEYPSTPQLTVDLEWQAASSDWIVKHNGNEVKEIHIIWSYGAVGSFTLDANVPAGGPIPRVKETAFEYTGSGADQTQPYTGGMTWSYADNKLTFVFNSLGAPAEKTKGMWLFNPSNMPPIKLKVVIERKNDFACSQATGCQEIRT